MGLPGGASTSGSVTGTTGVGGGSVMISSVGSAIVDCECDCVWLGARFGVRFAAHVSARARSPACARPAGHSVITPYYSPGRPPGFSYYVLIQYRYVLCINTYFVLSDLGINWYV